MMEKKNLMNIEDGTKMAAGVVRFMKTFSLQEKEAHTDIIIMEF